MNKQSYQVILRPLITEKGMEMVEKGNAYPFEVAIDATKGDIERAITDIFDVRVKSVRTMMRRGKPRRVRINRGYTRRWKRAVITLMPGETINFI